ncbi:MAG: ATP-binding protein [Candidatus Hydrothermarchaeota archaeon]
MGIRPEVDSVHFSNHEEEKTYALCLDEAFDISFAAQHGRRGELSFWLADPKTHAKERFGLQNEVLVIYSPHYKTDARVLTAIENITRSPDFKHRVDRVLYLLIHNGNLEATAALVKNDLTRIIVPIHVRELMDPKKGNFFIRSRIAKYIGEFDLFGMSSPITSDKYFFGRDELVQSLLIRATARHENSGLFGLRKTGKTSVLRALQRRVEERPILVAYVDCSNPGMHSGRWWQALENLRARLADAFRRHHRRQIIFDEHYDQITAGPKFSLDVQRIVEEGSFHQIILMLDEIEYITPKLGGALGKHWGGDFTPFWQTIRSTHQETQGKLVFIVAGVNPACVENTQFGGLSNPIFQLAVPNYLEPFTTVAVREMARSIGRYSGLKFDETVYGYLQEQYGGHPFLIRIACSEVWKSKDTHNPESLSNVAIEDFKQRSPEIKARITQPIKDILLSLVWWYPEEYKLLQVLAQNGHQSFQEYLRRQPEAMLRFGHYGILKSDNSGEFAIADLKNFLNERGEEYKLEISPFTRGDLPPELLPEIPDLAVLGQLFEKRCEIEIKLRRTIVMYLGMLSNWDPHKMAEAMLKGVASREDRKSPSELFVGRRPQDVINELYTLDLKNIILANWSVFQSLFDNQEIRFKMNMDTINRARRVEGHTKPITETEVLDFKNSYAWLLSRLAKVPKLE